MNFRDTEEKLQKHSRRLVEDIYALEPDIASEVDLKQLFERILGREDWTDKVVSGLRKLRSMIHRPVKDSPLPEELRLLIPDMKEVEKTYLEMTSGYRDFIRAVWEAQNQRRWRE